MNTSQNTTNEGNTQIKHNTNLPLLQSNNLMLGSNTEFASTRVNTAIETIPRHEQLADKLKNNVNRYELQRIAQRIMIGHRIGACMKALAPTKDVVQLHYNKEENHAHYRNLMRCDNVWLCPVCSARITSERANDIRKAYAYATETLNWRVVMVTYTMSHRNFDSLQSNVNDLREARRKMRSGRRWQEFKQKYGYEHCISSLETPYNEENGWHVHVHELMFLNPDNADYELHEKSSILDDWLGQELTGLWIKSLNAVGRSASWSHGIDVTSTDSNITKYISKYGKLPSDVTWDVAYEMTKTMSKKRSESLHPFEILLLARDDYQYRKLWIEYALAFDGKAQIFWSKGLKDLCLIEEEEVQEEEVQEETLVLEIDANTWKDVYFCQARARLLNYTILCNGDKSKIEQWLHHIRVYSEQWKNRKLADGDKCDDS